MQAALPSHLECIVIAKVTIENQIGQREPGANTGQQRTHLGLDAREFGGEGHGGFGDVGAAFGSTGLAFGSCGGRAFGGGLGACGRAFFWRAQHLFDGDRKRFAVGGADQREGKEGQARHRFAIQTGKEAVEAGRVFARFGHDGFITANEIDMVGAQEMGAKEEPEERGPGKGSMKEPLDGAIAAAVARPAGDAQHGDTAGHGEHGQRDSTELADGGQGKLRLETQQEW